MSHPSSVNAQITDAVTQANVKVIGEAPAMALGNLFEATSRAIARAALNPLQAQSPAALTGEAAFPKDPATETPPAPAP